MANTATKTKTDSDIKYPNLYNVVLYNDDKTTVQFVIGLLVEVYNKTLTEAVEVTEEIHLKGKGVAGVYTMEIAESKVEETTTLARANDFPLVAVAEEI